MIPDWFPHQELPELQTYSDFYLVTEGGFGEIYSAKYQENGFSRDVIVKRLRPLYTEEAKQRELFVREARFYKLFKHPQIPGYFDGFLSERECFFIIQRISGSDPARLLQNARASGVTLSTALILEFGIRACDILDYLHHFKNELGEPDPIIHSDIKPHNFLMTQEPQIYLIDFSVAQFIHHPTKHIGGTPSFMAPERMGAQALSPQMDLFPLTLTLYFLLTRETPLKGPGMTDLLGGYFEGHHLKAIEKQNFPKPLEDFFLKNLQLKPEKRAPDALALQQDILELFSALKLDRDTDALKDEIKALSQIS